jgi:hypothetical protein
MIEIHTTIFVLRLLGIYNAYIHGLKVFPH